MNLNKTVHYYKKTLLNSRCGQS